MQYEYLDYLNIAQLKTIHKNGTVVMKAMRERTLPRGTIDIQLFARQHEYAIQEQQEFLNEVAKRISKLESLFQAQSK